MTEPIVGEATFAQQVERARRTAIIAKATEARAVLAHYDALNESGVIQLKSGATFTFPSSIAQGLSEASSADLAAVEITPSGEGLHWEALDADLHVPSLLAGVFGSRSWMDKLRSRWQQVS